MPRTIQFHFKTPDVIENSCDEDMSHEDFDHLKKALSKWIQHNESVTLIYDLDNDTMTVRKS